jgi:amidohydrolase
MDAKAIAQTRITEARGSLIDLSHRIHAKPEIAFQEREASGWLANFLAAAGFDVELGAYALPTAFTARTGTGPLHIAICAEYDALPKIGHACGHNIIAAAAVGAGIALADTADELGLTVTVLGTPAEEGGAGKIFMLERNAFKGVHAAMMVHPAPVDVAQPAIIAAQRVEVEYSGKEAHASSYPQAGVNAADALTVAQVAIGLIRQHIRPTDRIHGIVTRGGDAPNIVPAHTAASYSMRALTINELEDVRTKVLRCFEAGALATGCEWETRVSPYAYAEMKHDREIATLYQANAEALGRRFPEPRPEFQQSAGSTDMGNVSQAVPSIHPMIGIDSWPAANHQPEFAAHCVTVAGDQAVTDGAVALAWTVVDVATDEKLRQRLIGES